MRVTFQDEEFRAFTDYSEKDLIKGKGWQWGPYRTDGKEAGKFWWTTRLDVAAPFAQFADESCRTKLAEIHAAQEASREMSRATDAPIVVPAPEGLEYLPYQKAGIQFFSTHPKMLLADQMGLGKTIQVLGAINYDPDIKTVLVICPASLRLNWYREATKWLTRKFNIGIAVNSSFPFEADFVIINFDILARHAAALREKTFDLLVIDESHFLKNPKAKRTQQVFGNKEIAPIPARRVMLLTGTPILNRPKEIWPLISYLDPKTWNSWWYFAKRYCAAVRGRWGWDFDGAANLGELQDKLRRTCFHGDTEIDSEHGQVKISDIKRCLPIRVWSSDSMGRLSLKPVIGFSKIAYRGFLIKICHAKGEILCTPDHRIFTDKGEKRAGEIVAGDCLCSMSQEENTRTPQIGSSASDYDQQDVLLMEMCGKAANERQTERVLQNTTNSSTCCDQDLRRLWDSVYGEEHQGLPKQTVPQLLMQSKVGLSAFLSTKAKFTGSDKTSSRQATQTKAATIAPANEKTPALEIVYSGQFGASARPGTPTASQGIERFTGDDRRSDNDWRNEPVCRHIDPAGENRDRGGRIGSCTSPTTDKGQRKRSPFTFSRVLSVEVLGVGDRRKSFGGTKEDFFVYDLQVEQNHNYFANGILVHNCMVRRLKEDVLKELPPKRRQVIAFPSDSVQMVIRAEREGYEKHQEKIEDLRLAVEMSKASDNPEDYKNAVKALQAGVGAAFAEIAKLRHDTAIAKLPMVIDHLRDMLDSDDKIVLFAHHHDVQNKLMKEFGGEAVLHRGGLSDEDKQTAVDRFQNDQAVKLFVGSIKASGLGITLTAASNAVFAELDWTPAWVSQCEDRIHRIGQAESVLIQHLVLDGSLDAEMAQRLIDKQAIIDLALDDTTAQQDAIAASEPILPIGKKDEPISTTVKELEDESKMLSFEQVKQIHAGLRLLAGVCDGAATRDDTGFNRFDVKLGHELAKLSSLTVRQAALGKKILKKYHRQLAENGLVIA